MGEQHYTSNLTMRLTMFSNMEALRFEGVAGKHFTALQKLRVLYEKQLQEKNREPGVAITTNSYWASTDDFILRIFITTEWIAAKTIDKVTEDLLRKCIKDRPNFKSEGK